MEINLENINKLDLCAHVLSSPDRLERNVWFVVYLMLGFIFLHAEESDPKVNVTKEYMTLGHSN